MRAATTTVAVAALVACDGGDHLVGESVDATESPAALFAIAYLDHEQARDDNVAWRINPAVGVVIAVSATGAPVELADLHVVSVDDDSPRVDISFAIVDPSTELLPAGQAAGRIASGWKWLAPLVPEPIASARPSLAYRVDYLDPAPHAFDAVVHATVVLAVGGEQATLPFTLDVRATGPLGGGPVSARRVRSIPAP